VTFALSLLFLLPWLHVFLRPLKLGVTFPSCHFNFLCRHNSKASAAAPSSSSTSVSDPAASCHSSSSLSHALSPFCLKTFSSSLSSIPILFLLLHLPLRILSLLYRSGCVVLILDFSPIQLHSLYIPIQSAGESSCIASPFPRAVWRQLAARC
jgi:hypothetical protein